MPRRARLDAVVEIAGVDTTRQRGRLMLFTPAYHQHTDTPATGLEWVVQGKPLRVISGPLSTGKTPIPRDGYVLSFGGTRPPPPLQSLRIGTPGRAGHELHGRRRQRRRLGEGRSHRRRRRPAAARRADHHRLEGRAARADVRRDPASANARRHASRRIDLARDRRRPSAAAERGHVALRAARPGPTARPAGTR